MKLIIQIAFNRQASKSKNSKKKASARYRLTEGAEPKLIAVREMLSIYRDIHLKNPTLKDKKLLTTIHNYYKSRIQKRWQKILMSLQVDTYQEDEMRALRNMRRYLQRARTIVMNVVKGNFLGEY